MNPEALEELQETLANAGSEVENYGQYAGNPWCDKRSSPTETLAWAIRGIEEELKTLKEGLQSLRSKPTEVSP